MQVNDVMEIKRTICSGYAEKPRFFPHKSWEKFKKTLDLHNSQCYTNIELNRMTDKK